MHIMAVFAISVLDYYTHAAFAYQCWVEDERLVFAVDINHRCDNFDIYNYYHFMKIVVNQDSLFRVILFTKYSYYAVKELCTKYSSDMGPFLRLYCPCCWVDFNDPWQ